MSGRMLAARVESTTARYLRRPTALAVDTYGPSQSTFTSRTPGILNTPAWGAFGSEADISDQGTVIHSVTTLRNQNTREFARGHFVFMQRYPHLESELPNVNEPATLSSLNLLLRKKAFTYWSVKRILDQWRPAGFINNVFEQVKDWGLNTAPQEMVNITIGNVAKNVFNYWLDSSDKDKHNTADIPGMFCGFVLKFVKPPPSVLGVHGENIPSQPSVLGKRKLTGDPSVDAFFETLDLDARMFANEKQTIPDDIKEAMKQGWCYQWVAHCSLFADPPTFEELTVQLPSGRRMQGYYLPVCMPVFLKNTTERGKNTVYIISHCRDHPQWNSLVSKMPRTDALLIMGTHG